MKKEITVEVIKEIKKIQDDKSPFFIGVLKWNNGKPKVNIRHMYLDKNTGEFRFGKGIALTDEEVISTYDALGKYIEEKDL